MGLFSKPKPIDQFNANYFELKTIAFKNMIEFRPLIEKEIGKIEDDEYDVLCLRCIDYLLGADHPEPGPGSSARTLRIYQKMYKKAPIVAPKIRKVPMLDAYFAAILDYKDEVLAELLGDEWSETAEAKRVRKIISNTPASIEDTEDYRQLWAMLTTLK
jgi:hypothetical protein